MMGFSSSLQGSSSHDAILMRIDAELRLLENMRRCLSLRIKADREYAIGLNSFVLQVSIAKIEIKGWHDGQLKDAPNWPTDIIQIDIEKNKNTAFSKHLKLLKYLSLEIVMQFNLTYFCAKLRSKWITKFNLKSLTATKYLVGLFASIRWGYPQCSNIFFNSVTEKLKKIF